MTKTLYVIANGAPPYVHGQRVAPGDLISLTDAEALYERDLGHVVPTTFEAEAKPADLTIEERAALPKLVVADEVDPWPASAAELRWSAGTGLPMAPVSTPADAVMREFVPAGAPASPEPGTVASVPFMITADTRERLADLGRSADEIAAMTPAQAWAILNLAE